MEGDIIVVRAHHRKVAAELAGIVLSLPGKENQRIALTVGGESGCGKSETGTALVERLAELGVPAALIQQDDYFIYPPKSNDARRRSFIEWVGVQEVRLDLLDKHLRSFKDGASAITKPLVVYAEDRITEETVNVGDLRVIVAEGTYTTVLANADLRIFIDRTCDQTMEDRRARSREPIEPFLEHVLGIEHEIIAAQKQLADIIITDDFEVMETNRDTNGPS